MASVTDSLAFIPSTTYVLLILCFCSHTSSDHRTQYTTVMEDIIPLEKVLNDKQQVKGRQDLNHGCIESWARYYCVAVWEAYFRAAVQWRWRGGRVLLWSRVGANGVPPGHTPAARSRTSHEVCSKGKTRIRGLAICWSSCREDQAAEPIWFAILWRYTVELPNKAHLGYSHIVLCREVNCPYLGIRILYRGWYYQCPL